LNPLLLYLGVHVQAIRYLKGSDAKKQNMGTLNHPWRLSLLLVSRLTTPFNDAEERLAPPGGIRTLDLPLVRGTLYPLSYGGVTKHLICRG
jgi:hypothetical protein